MRFGFAQVRRPDVWLTSHGDVRVIIHHRAPLGNGVRIIQIVNTSLRLVKPTGERVIKRPHQHENTCDSVKSPMENCRSSRPFIGAHRF